MSTTKRKGCFIALEGIDGSGKSTQIRLLAERFRQAGETVYTTMEPTDSPFGKLLRRVLSGELVTDVRVACPLFAADRLDHLTGEDGIVQKLEQGTTVITDRYYFSSYAYQSVDLPMEQVIAVNAICAEVRRPDLTIFIDIDPDTAMERIMRNRDHVEIFEKRERLAQTRERYFEAFRRLETEEKVIVVDGTRSPEAIAEDLWEICSPSAHGSR